jgi:TMEM70/TMEM186/TMEM223 protein family
MNRLLNFPLICLHRKRLFNIVQHDRYVKLSSQACARVISSSCNFRNVNSEKAGENFQMIYRFPYVVPAKVICRLKLYQTGIVSAFTAVSFFCGYDVFVPLVVGSVSLVMLGVMGEFFRKLIGAVYLNSHKNQVKISHLDFFGNRKDVFVNIDDIVPISSTNETPSDPYVKIIFSDEKRRPLLISLKYGKVLDEKTFQEVFGHFKNE